MGIRKVLSSHSRQLRTLGAALVVGLSLLYLARQMVGGLQQLDLTSLHPRWLSLVFSVLLFVGSTFVGGICWSLILAGLGHQQPLRQSLKAHLSANIAKYVPGYAWQILGKAYLCQGQGVPGETIAVGIFCEFAGVILTGLWVACLLLPSAWLELWRLSSLQAWRWPFLIGLTALLAASPALLRWAWGRWPRRSAYVVVHPWPLWSTLLWMLTAWLALGSAVYLCTDALYPTASSAWSPLTFSWAATSLLSLAIIFVPTGIGIKEGALTFLLGLQIPGAIAAMVAIITRLFSIVAEGLWFLLAQRM